MTLLQYLTLSSEEQITALWDKGAYMASRRAGSICYVLYEIGDFYIEVSYSTTDNQFYRFRPFKSTARLREYWEQVNIDDLKQVLRTS